MSERKDVIAQALGDVRAQINTAAIKAARDPNEITLIAVTKTYPASDVAILHQLGINNFGENRTEEGSKKSTEISATWHFQGKIQSRKIAEIISWAHFIHSIDNANHIEKLGRICQEVDKKLSVFIQLSLDGAPSRGGVIESALSELAERVLSSTHLALVGLMCVPPVEYEHHRAFSEIASTRERFRSSFPDASALSAGMSGDFELAIGYGATHLRVGSQILGSRTNHP